jgi:undecaprenyl-diphosphatase
VKGAGRIFIAAGSLLLLSALVYSGVVDAFDRRVLMDIDEAQSANSLLFWRCITWAGAPVAVFAVAMVLALVLYVQSKWSDAKFVALAIIAASVLDTPFKYLVHRPRPSESLVAAMPTSFSFPSGHVLFATAFYGSLAMVLVKSRTTASSRMIWLCAGIIVALVTLSRLCLGVHYPSDVLGGLLSGLLCVLLAHWMSKPATNHAPVG